MKSKFTLLLAGSAALMLGACSSCPKTADYGKVPYTTDRTAGGGLAHYGGKCAEPEPMMKKAKPVKKADPMFERKLRK